MEDFPAEARGGSATMWLAQVHPGHWNAGRGLNMWWRACAAGGAGGARAHTHTFTHTHTHTHTQGEAARKIIVESADKLDGLPVRTSSRINAQRAVQQARAALSGLGSE
jgi:hypothetical protein